MNPTSRRTFLASSTAAAAVALAPQAAWAAPKDEGELAKLYAAARKEGTVTWWTAHYALDAAEKVRDAFKAKYPGIDVQFTRQPAQTLYQRLTQDLKANVKQCDVFASTDEAHYLDLKKQNSLASFKPIGVDVLDPKFRGIDHDNTYHTGAFALVVMGYNKKLVVPRRWTNLVDAKYKDQITLGHPAFSGYMGAWVVAMNDKYSWRFFTNLAKNNPKVNRSIQDTINDMISGQRLVGTTPDGIALEKKAAGNPVDILLPDDDSVLIASPVGILKDAPHPNAARLFESFYYTKEYSEAVVRAFNLPLRTDVPSSNGMKLATTRYQRVAADRLVAGVPEAIAKWRETFGV